MTAWIPNVVPDQTIESAWGNTIRDRTVTPFTNPAARDAAIPAPKVGMVCYLTTGKVSCFFDGTNWIGTQFGIGMYTSNAGGGADIPYPVAFKVPPAVIAMVMTPAGGNSCWGSLHSASNNAKAHVLFLNSVGGVVALVPSYSLQVSWVAVGPI